MHTYNGNVLIYLQKDLHPQIRDHIQFLLGHQQGVTALDWNQRLHHLLHVHYDPCATSAWKLLQHVRSTGTHASLVGF